MTFNTVANAGAAAGPGRRDVAFRRIFAFRGPHDDVMPAVARGWVDFTDLENQDNAPLWGAETTETWTTANGSDFVLIYGKPGTVALGELNDLGIGDLRFDFFRLPGDQRLHGRRHRPRWRLPQ